MKPQWQSARGSAPRRQRCILVGAGGHAKVLLDCLQQRNIKVLGFVERDATLHGKLVCGLPVLGGDADLLHHAPGSVLLVNAIGSTRAVSQRKSVYDSLRQKGYQFLTVVHPSVVLAAGVTLAEGVQVMAGAVIQADAAIGENTIVNTGALIDHDCAIGAHVHVAPGCVLSGGVRIGDCTHLGTGAIVIQGVTIGSRCLVAAGAVVVRNVADGAVVKGVPAKEDKR